LREAGIISYEKQHEHVSGFEEHVFARTITSEINKSFFFIGFPV